MKYYRYGKFRFKDYWQSWISITVLLSFAIASGILKLPLVLFVFPIVYAVVWIWTIIVPQFEQFILNNDVIISCFGRKKRVIELPSELTLVVSYVDICPLFSARTAIGNQTQILKGRYAVSILHSLSLNIALEKLHLNYLKFYTTSTVQRVFADHQYIYSFVCDQSLLSKLVKDRQYQVIVPESLFEQIATDWHPTNIYVDKGY